MHRRVAHTTETTNENGGPDGVARRRKRRIQRSWLSLITKPRKTAAGVVNALILVISSFFLTALVLLVLSRSSGGHSAVPATTNHERTDGDDDDAAQQSHRKTAIRPHAGDTVQDLDVLPFHPLYRVPEAMPQVGDRSEQYARLRKETDALMADRAWFQRHLDDVLQRQRGQGFVARPMHTAHSDQVPYDVFNCPPEPPEGYPFAWKLVHLLREWPVDQIQPPRDDDRNAPLLHHSLCVFDYSRDYDKALAYRDASLPFVVINDPAVQRTAVRWALPNYMEQMLGPVLHRAEYSESNHFMYYVPPPKGRRGRSVSGALRSPRGNVPKGWKEPTQMIRMTFRDWLHKANNTRHANPSDPHWYFRLIGCGTMGNDGSCDSGSSEYLFDELPFFQPKQSLYVVDPNEQKGVHCRFGMQGVIAESHFDGSRNSIALLGGSRRYILSHPDQCENLALYPIGHPSARHSAVNWSDPDLEEFPEFAEARANEILLQAGQVLYLPTNWFHFIVSLELNYQCNTRSGIERNMMEYIKECGF